MSECANSSNIGFFNGTFMTLANIGRTFGFIMGAYIIVYIEVSTFYWVLAGFTFFSSTMMCLLPEPKAGEETPLMRQLSLRPKMTKV